MEKICPNCAHRFDTQIAPGLKDACPKCMMEFLMDETGESQSHRDGEWSAPAQQPLEVGSTIRGMEVLQFLGQGGMGFVYKARQPNLDRVVALKILDPRLATSAEFTSRFNREAKALAALSHPNIIQVYDYGREGEHYFLVMEFVDGASLQQILTTQRMTPETALRYVPQICDALGYAHSQGVIHRDIKPGNILIDKHGNLKIADFGLARIVGSQEENKSEATAVGRVMGTPHYMAPEQVKGMASVDHRADIYSLGVVFYEMLTGELPIGRFPAPSQQLRVDVRVDEVVLKALEKEPERRYQRASLMKDDITRISVAKSPVHARNGIINLRGWLLVGGLVAVLLVILAVKLSSKPRLTLEFPQIGETPSENSGVQRTITSKQAFNYDEPNWLAEMKDSSPVMYWGITFTFWAFLLGGTFFWLWMLIDCIRRKEEEVRFFTKTGKDDKLIWLGLIIFLSVPGAIVYWLVVRRRKGVVTA